MPTGTNVIPGSSAAVGLAFKNSTVASYAQGAAITATDSFSMPFPSGISVGDLIVVSIACGNLALPYIYGTSQFFAKVVPAAYGVVSDFGDALAQMYLGIADGTEATTPLIIFTSPLTTPRNFVAQILVYGSTTFSIPSIDPYYATGTQDLGSTYSLTAGALSSNPKTKILALTAYGDRNADLPFYGASYNPTWTNPMLSIAGIELAGVSRSQTIGRYYNGDGIIESESIGMMVTEFATPEGQSPSGAVTYSFSGDTTDSCFATLIVELSAFMTAQGPAGPLQDIAGAIIEKRREFARPPLDYNTI